MAETLTLQNLRLKNYFKQNQRLLLKLINTEGGRYLLGIKDKYPIVKLTPNSFHQWGGDRYFKAKFWCRNSVAQILLPAFTMNEISEIPITYESFLHFTNLERKAYKYPTIYLTDTTFYAGGGDGSCYHSHTNYTTCHDATASTDVDYTTGTNRSAVDNGYINPNYFIKRSFYPADTSGLTSAAVLTDGYLSHCSARDNNAQSDTVQIVNTTQASTNELVVGDYDNVDTTNNGALALASYPASAAQTQINLSATGLTNISKTGVTKMGLRLQGDINASQPAGRNDTWPDSFSEDVLANRPFYSLTYTIVAGGSKIIHFI